MPRLRFFALVMALLPAIPAPAAMAADTVVRVVVSNVAKPDGVLLAGAYTSAETWLGPTPLVSKHIPVAGNVRNGAVSFEIMLPPGKYALSVLQDMNANRRLDTNFLGIPTEASGSSNDAPARWSAPKFQAAVFTVGAEPVALAIRLN